jgi:hypothetical protein
MKYAFLTAIMASFITISASASEAVQQNSEKPEKFTTTQEYLAQPNIEPLMENVEPAAGAVATNSKNPLLERKFNNFKK